MDEPLAAIEAIRRITVNNSTRSFTVDTNMVEKFIGLADTLSWPHPHAPVVNGEQIKNKKKIQY